ncbi:hypothetical protein WDZ92_04905 [Nostoc sp. NIES-2111]
MALVLGIGIVAQERWVRSYDDAGYYQGCVYVAREMLPNFLTQGIRYLYHTIETEEYNALLCYWVGPGLRFAGVDIPTYTLVLGLLGLLPFGYLVQASIRRWAEDAGAPDTMGIAAGFIALLLPAVYAPWIHGMADIALLPFATLALLVGIRILISAGSGTLVHKVPAGLWLAALLMLVLLPLLRRYFGIYVIAWFGAFGVGILLELLARRASFRIFWTYAAGMTALAVITGLVWYRLFPHFFASLFFKQYADVYKAYRAGDLGLDLHYLWTQFGPLTWGLAAMGLVTLSASPRLRFVGWVLALHLMLTTTGVLRIQSFSPHHYYLLAPTLALLAGAGMLLPWALIRKEGMMRRFLGVGWTALTLTAAVGSFFYTTPLYGLSPSVRRFAPLAASVSLQPRVRHDLNVLRSLAEDVRQLNPNGTKRVYIAGSGASFNDDVLRNLFIPDFSPGISGLIPGVQHAQVDRRDPFPKAFLTADLVILPVPMLYHLKPEDQQLAAWVQHTVTDSAGLGRHYRLLKRYGLEDAEARVYERISSLPIADVAASLASLRAAYPDYPAMYQLPDAPALESLYAQPGDGPYAQARLTDAQDELDLHPGKTLKTAVGIRLTEAGQYRIGLRFESACENGAAVVFVLRKNGQVQDSLIADHKSPVPFKPVVAMASDRFEVSIYPGPKEDFCDHVLVKFERER